MLEHKIEIFDEDNSILLEDDYGRTTLDFYPDTKQYKSNLSIKDDVYYRNELYEYKISLNPIEVQFRLIERSDEPPIRYAVQDGVVLESEITKDKTYSAHLIEELKKQVEWNNQKYYPILFFILSKHPEIISKLEYKKFLRLTEQRIGLGLSKIEKRLKDKDTTGLQIIDNEYGKQIWYSVNKDNEEAREEYIKLPDKKRNESKYGKSIEYVEKNFNTPLFDEKSPEYCGLSKYEFESSAEIINHIENLLNPKNTTKDGNSQEVSKAKTSPDRMKWFGYTWAFIVGIIELSIIGSLLGVPKDRFEEVILSSVIIIYASLRTMGGGLFFTTTEQLQKADKQFLYLSKIVNEKLFESQKEELQEILDEDKRKINKAKVKIYIALSFMAIIYFLALYHLVFSNFIQ